MKNKMEPINLREKIKNSKANKGSSKMLSLYWFVMLVIIAGGVFAMVTTFYGHPYDVRPLEADILSKKTADCLSKKGELNENLFNGSNGNFSLKFRENFLQECDFNFNLTDSKGRSQYYTEAEFFVINSSGNKTEILEEPVFEIRKGNINWKEGCDVEEEYSRSAECSEKRIYSLAPDPIPNKGGKQYLVKITSIIGKINANVK